MSILLYVIAGFMAFGGLVTTSSVGKPRKPVTGGAAAIAIVLDAFMVTVLIIAALKLGHHA